MALVRFSLVSRLPSIGGLGSLVFVSAVLHGGLLLLPLPQWWSAESEPEVVIEESGAIAITSLPIIAAPETKPEPETVTPVEPAPIPAEVVPPPPVQVPENLPDLTEPPVEPPVDESETLEELEPVADPFEENELDMQDSEPEAGIAFQFSQNFPHLSGAQTGCYGLQNCRITEGQNYIDALQEITDTLEAQGYQLDPYEGNDDSDVRNHKIYEMRLPDASEVKYLNVFGEGLKTTIYIITSRIITQEELESQGLSN